MGSHRGTKNDFGSIAMTLTGLLFIVTLHQASTEKLFFRPLFHFPSDFSDTPSQLFMGRLFIRSRCYPVNITMTPSVPNVNSTDGVEDSDRTNKVILLNCTQEIFFQNSPNFKDDEKIRKPAHVDDNSIANQRQPIKSTETVPEKIVYFSTSKSHADTFTWIHISIITIVISLCIAILVATFMMNRKIKQVDASRKTRAELARMFSSRRHTANNNYTTPP